MSIAGSSLVTNTTNPQEYMNYTTMTEEVSKVDQENLEIVRCFVCDAQVEGRRYALATCKTQCTRARVIEKLGQVVGERYVVVISEDDVICRSCANLINKLDRLESETKDVKSSVLRFLEKKYSLTEGELLSCSDVPRLGQPPQITKNNSQGLNCHYRKRGAVPDDSNCSTQQSKKSNNWMQCDKCRYTTTTNKFLDNHPKENAKKRILCKKCNLRFIITDFQVHNCKRYTSDNSMEKVPSNEVRAIQTAPLTTIDLTGTNEDPDEDATPMPVVSIPTTSDPLQSKDEQIPLFNLNTNSLQFPNFLASDGCMRDGQPLFMRVLQQFGANDDLGHGNLLPVTSNEIIKTKETTKQMLTLAEDGTLQMVAVDCWNDDNQAVQNSELAL